MPEGSISQGELDALFGTATLEELQEEPQHIWLVKSEDNRSVFGGRCFSLWQAQSLSDKVYKEYKIRTKIIQVK